MEFAEASAIAEKVRAEASLKYWRLGLKMFFWCDVASACRTPRGSMASSIVFYRQGCLQMRG